MAKRQRDLLDEIERDVLDESKSLASALLKCLSLGGHAGSADLREWAARELYGYPSREDLPDYRLVTAPLLMDGFPPGAQFRGKSVSVIELPKEAREAISDELPLTYGVAQIEGLIRQAESRGGSIPLGPPAGAELALMMTHEVGRYQVERIYWSVNAAVLRGVTSVMRGKLIELVAEMRAGTVQGEGIPPPAIAEQAVQFVLYGKGHRITLATAGEGGTAIAAFQDGASDERGFWTRSRRVGAAIVGLAGIVSAVAAVLALHLF